ncbi:MAG: helix-turn-helix domain-containing protein [Lachnospiraceae bacterium]|nr:helix-turn-helix domain-containing protein [Lachnospiraceae bacterium]
MDENTVIERLIRFGLTRQEAVIYICLLRGREWTGYEIAKQTGISRSNAYNGLAALTEKGAAYRMEGATSKYLAVSIHEFCSNRIRNLDEDRIFLEENLREENQETDGYITIEGDKNILNKMQNMISHTEKRIYLAASSQILKLLEPQLQELAKHNRKLVLITDQCDFPIQAKVYPSQKENGRVRLIVDSSYVLTGEYTGNSQDTCLYTGQTNFVQVFKEALSNEIKLIELTGGEEK